MNNGAGLTCTKAFNTRRFDSFFGLFGSFLQATNVLGAVPVHSFSMSSSPPGREFEEKQDIQVK